MLDMSMIDESPPREISIAEVRSCQISVLKSKRNVMN